MMLGIFIGAAIAVFLRLICDVVWRVIRRALKARTASGNESEGLANHRDKSENSRMREAERFKRAAYMSMHNVNEPSAIKKFFGLS